MDERTLDVATERAAATRHSNDPVITEIVRNGLIAVTEEMKTNLMRTAYNMIIYEALDFTVGLFTPQAETVSIGIGLPKILALAAIWSVESMWNWGPRSKLHSWLINGSLRAANWKKRPQ